MQRRHPLPKLWLMTDERQGEALWAALAALPRGAGVVFRHYSLPPDERRALFAAVRAVARRKGLALARDTALNRHGLRTAAAHNSRELGRANRSRAALVFLSPVYPTRSHPGAPALGRRRFAVLARRSRIPVIALGGMNRARFHTLKRSGAYGWAAIDALTPENQNLNAVPT